MRIRFLMPMNIDHQRTNGSTSVQLQQIYIYISASMKALYIQGVRRLRPGDNVHQVE
jgi:hypothetical protein